MTDLAHFSPASFDELLEVLVAEGGEAIGTPLENIQAVTGYLRILADGSMKTMRALAEGRIDAQTAADVLAERKEVLVQTAEFTGLMGLVAAQRLADAVFRVVGWAILNRTGLNLAPELVTPE